MYKSSLKQRWSRVWKHTYARLNHRDCRHKGIQSQNGDPNPNLTSPGRIPLVLEILHSLRRQHWLARVAQTPLFSLAITFYWHRRTAANEKTCTTKKKEFTQSAKIPRLVRFFLCVNNIVIRQIARAALLSADRSRTCVMCRSHFLALLYIGIIVQLRKMT